MSYCYTPLKTPSNFSQNSPDPPGTAKLEHPCPIWYLFSTKSKGRGIWIIPPPVATPTLCFYNKISYPFYFTDVIYGVTLSRFGTF